jgi:dihydroneopterin aldolase
MVSFRVSHNVAIASDADDVETTLDYEKLYHHITSTLTTSRKDFNDLQDLAFTILSCHPATEPKHAHDPLSKLPYMLSIKLPQGVIRAEKGLRYTQTRESASDRAGTSPMYCLSQSLEIKDIKCLCIIGVNKYEHSTSLPIILNVEFLCRKYFPDAPESSDVVKALGCYQEMVRIITDIRLLVLISIAFIFSFPIFSFNRVCWNLNTDVVLPFFRESIHLRIRHRKLWQLLLLGLSFWTMGLRLSLLAWRSRLRWLALKLLGCVLQEVDLGLSLRTGVSLYRR